MHQIYKASVSARFSLQTPIQSNYNTCNTRKTCCFTFMYVLKHTHKHDNVLISFFYTNLFHPYVQNYTHVSVFDNNAHASAVSEVKWHRYLSLNSNSVLLSLKSRSMLKGKLSDSFTNYNYVGNTKVSVSIKNT